MTIPTQFLTLGRRTMLRSSLSSRPIQRQALRPFSLSTRRNVEQYPKGGSTDSSVSTSAYPDSEHATNKEAKSGEPLDVQSREVSKGKSDKASGQGGTATKQADSTSSHAKTKQSHPEAPDTIGMQDERGGKGLHS